MKWHMALITCLLLLSLDFRGGVAAQPIDKPFRHQENLILVDNAQAAVLAVSTVE